EQLGNVMAKVDGIGIAKQMYIEQLRRQEGKIVNASTDDDYRNTALSMIDDFQRKTFVTPTAEAKTDRKGFRF
ncbi:rod-binding protein, partial [Rhizobium ruizarguesonis]